MKWTLHQLGQFSSLIFLYNIPHKWLRGSCSNVFTDGSSLFLPDSSFNSWTAVIIAKSFPIIRLRSVYSNFVVLILLYSLKSYRILLSQESNQLFEYWGQDTYSQSSPCRILLHVLQPFLNDMVLHSSDKLDTFFWMHFIWLMSLLKYCTRRENMIARLSGKKYEKQSSWILLYIRKHHISFHLGTFWPKIRNKVRDVCAYKNSWKILYSIP